MLDVQIMIRVSASVLFGFSSYLPNCCLTYFNWFFGLYCKLCFLGSTQYMNIKKGSANLVSI